MSIKTLALRMPSIVRKARSASFLIVAGTFGSLVAIASCTLTSPLSIWIDFTNPNETMSRVKPGYFTAFNAFFTCSSEIDIFQGNRPASDVNRHQGGSSCPQDDGIAEGQLFQCIVSAQIPGGRAAVSNALSRLRQGYGGPRDNAFHLLSHPDNRLFPREKRVGCCSAFATKSFFCIQTSFHRR